MQQGDLPPSATAVKPVQMVDTPPSAPEMNTNVINMQPIDGGMMQIPNGGMMQVPNGGMMQVPNAPEQGYFPPVV